MSVIDITQDNLDEFLEKSGIIVIKFTASWCGPCQSFAPIYKQVAQQFPSITFAEIDTEKQPELAAEFAVRSVPFLMVLKDKVLVYSESGTLPASALEDLIKQAEALDVSEVKQNNDEQ